MLLDVFFCLIYFIVLPEVSTVICEAVYKLCIVTLYVYYCNAEYYRVNSVYNCTVHNFFVNKYAFSGILVCICILMTIS